MAAVLKRLGMKEMDEPGLRTSTEARQVVVAIPTLNEADHIEGLIRDLLADPLFAGSEPARIWVVDGGSTDTTRDKVAKLAAGDRRVKLVDNPERTQSCAINLAADLAAAEDCRVLVRIDAHAHYPAGFVSGLVQTLATEACDSVVTPMRTVGGDPMRDAAADLYNSWLGNGGSPHRSGKFRGFVEHGHHAAFRLEAFREAGGYDPRFIANEDAELDKRLTKAGRRIFLENRLIIDYVPRSTASGYWRQMWRNGRFRMWTAAKHGEPLGLRQMLPILVALGLVGSTLLSLAAPIFLAIPLAYLVLVTVLAVRAATAPDIGRIARIVLLAAISHLAFGLGAIRGMLEMVGGKAEIRSPR